MAQKQVLVRMPEFLYETLLRLVGRKQEETGERVTVTSLINGLIQAEADKDEGQHTR